MHNIDHMARAIISAHTALALESAESYKDFGALAQTNKAQSAINLVVQNTVFQAVYQASLALNFIAADAHCIALAWQAQTARTGAFDAQAWPTLPQDFGLQADARTDAFAVCPRRLGLYAVVPDAAWVGRMARAGVPTVQLRFKSDDALAVAQQVRASVEAVKGTDCLLFINDHWQAAIDAGAYGVHLGQEDLDAADLASIRTAGLRLGISSHGYAEMLRAHRQSPSYIAMGAVFATTLKRMTTPPQGLARLKVYAQLLRDCATVAIGGIDLARLPAVLACGVGSVGVVRALMASAEPEMAVDAFLGLMRGAASAGMPE